MINFVLIVALAVSPIVQGALDTAYAMGRCSVYIDTGEKVEFWRDVNSNENDELRQALSDNYYKGVEDSRSELPTLQECQSVFKAINERINDVDN